MYIRKIFFLFITSIFLFTTFSHSNVILTWWGIQVLEETQEETKLTAKIDSFWGELSWINARFCNNWLEDLTEKITHSIWQMEIWNICVVVKNDTNNDAKVNLSFSDQSITSAWNIACDRSGKSTFAWFLDTSDIQVEVEAWSYVVKNFKIQFPIWVDWKQSGCLFYNVEKENREDQMLNIVVWRGMFLDYFVWELWEIENNLKLTIIDKKIENNELIVSVWAKNIWNIDLKTDIKWSLTNSFWINKPFSVTWDVVRVNNSFVFSLNFWQLPTYKWFFNINIEAEHSPHFDFDISWFDIDPTVLEPKQTKISTAYFEMPRLFAGWLLLIIILIILALRKPKQKVVYVKQQ